MINDLLSGKSTEWWPRQIKTAALKVLFSSHTKISPGNGTCSVTRVQFITSVKTQPSKFIFLIRKLKLKE